MLGRFAAPVFRGVLFQGAYAPGSGRVLLRSRGGRSGARREGKEDPRGLPGHPSWAIRAGPSELGRPRRKLGYLPGLRAVFG